VVGIPGPSSGRPLDRDSRHPWRATRRGFLAGGALALLAAGCGEEENVVARPDDALQRQLEAETALAAATAEVPVGAPRTAADTVREVSARSEARMRRLATAHSDQRYETVKVERVDAEQAVAIGQAAIVAHVAALPSFTGPEQRRLGADLVAGAAADTAVLSDALGIPVHDPFPGTPA
jgi:hypothetical protein